MAISTHNEQELTEFVEFFKLSAALAAENKPIPVNMLTDCLSNDNREHAKAKHNRAIKKILLKLHPDKATLHFIPLYAPTCQSTVKLLELQKKIREKFNAAVIDRTPEALLFMQEVNRRLLNEDPAVEHKDLQDEDFFNMPEAVGLERKYTFSTEIQTEASQVFSRQLAYLLQKGIDLPQKIENIFYHTAVNKGAEVAAFALTLLEKKLTDLLIAKGTKLAISKLLKGVLGCVTDAIAMYTQLNNIKEIVEKSGKTIQEFLSAKPDAILKQLRCHYPMLSDSDKNMKKGISGLQFYYKNAVNHATQKASVFVADKLKMRTLVSPISIFCLNTLGKEIGGISGTFFAERYIKNQLATPVHNMLTNILGAHNPQLKCLSIETDNRKLAKMIGKNVQDVGGLLLSDEASLSMLKSLNEQIERSVKKVGLSVDPKSFIFTHIARVGSGIANYIPALFRFSAPVPAPLNALVLQQNAVQAKKSNKLLKALDKDMTPLMQAVVLGDLKTVESALSLKETDMNANVGGITALHLALLFGHTDIAKALLALPQCAYNMPGGFDRATPLAIACFTANIEIVQFILEKDPSLDLNMPMASGKTLLHYACKGVSQSTLEQSFAIIKTLIQRGALLGATDSDAKTPLQDCPHIPNIIQLIREHMGDHLVANFELELKALQENPTLIGNEFRALLQLCHQLKLSSSVLQNAVHQQTIDSALRYAIANQQFDYANHVLGYDIACPLFSVEEIKQILPGMIAYHAGELPLLTAVLNQCMQMNNPDLHNTISELFQKKLSTTLESATWLNFLPGAIDYGKMAITILKQYGQYLYVQDINKLLELALRTGYTNVAQLCVSRATNLSDMIDLIDKTASSRMHQTLDYLDIRKDLVKALHIDKPLLLEDEQKISTEHAGIKAYIEPLIEQTAEAFQQSMRLILNKPNAQTCLQASIFENDTLFIHLIKLRKYEHANALLTLSEQLSLDKRLDVNTSDIDGKTAVLLCLENLSAYTWTKPSNIEKDLSLRLLELVNLSINNQKQKLTKLLALENQKGYLSRNCDVQAIFEKLNTKLNTPALVYRLPATVYQPEVVQIHMKKDTSLSVS